MRIGKIENYYGGLYIKEEDGKYYWSIENFDGQNFKEIPKYLYQALLCYEKARKEIIINSINRVEVIDENGRSYVNWKENNIVDLSYQDNNRTLKIFIKDDKND
jgi:hypothetical protein